MLTPIKIELESFEIWIPEEVGLRIAEEEFNKLTAYDMRMDHTIVQFVEKYIRRLVHQYDAGREDFIRDRLGLTDEK